MRIARLLALFLVLLLSLPLFAVTLTMGNTVASVNGGDPNIGTVRTDIDLVHPASHSGSVSTATAYWSGAQCANALKIKFFRRVGDTLTMTAERGPFTTANTIFGNYNLIPAVTVQQGDLIGVARVGNCGNPGALGAFPSEGFLQYAGDVSGAVDINAAAGHPGGVLAVTASGTATEWMARVIPVVGSVQGNFGSQFKTEMQFFNPQTTGSMTCKVVFHPMGVAGSSNDTTRLVALDPGEVFSTADVVAAMGQTGIGSLDVTVPATQAVPMLMTRVYNDAGSAGTSSLTEEAIAYTSATDVDLNVLARGVTAFLVTPRDPNRTRFNIGIRTLYSGATVSITVRNSDGSVVRSLSRTYTANYFVQTDAATFAGGPISGDQTIQISGSSGSAIVYGSTTDNTTNDPAMQLAYGVFAIA